MLSAALEDAIIHEIELSSCSLSVHYEEDVISFHYFVVPAEIVYLFKINCSLITEIDTYYEFMMITGGMLTRCQVALDGILTRPTPSGSRVLPAIEDVSSIQY